VHVVHNWSWQPARVVLPQRLVDLLDPAAGTVAEVELGAWDVRVLGE
jgi:beta-galactosidase